MTEDEIIALVDQKWKNFCLFFPYDHTVESKVIFEQGVRAGIALSMNLPAIETADDIHGLDPRCTYGRMYIPLPCGWEVQTKGDGSTYRLLDKKTGHRFPIMSSDGDRIQSHFTKMALEIHERFSYRGK